MALNKSLNHSYFLVKFVAESTIQFKIVNSSVVCCNYSTLDENIFIKFSDMIRQCSVVSTSNSVPDLEYKIPGLREENDLMDFDEEDVKPDVNHLIKIEEEIMVDEEVKPDHLIKIEEEESMLDEDVKPDVNHLIKIEEEIMVDEDVKPDHLIKIEEEESMLDEEVKPDVNHLIKIEEEIMVDEDVKPDHLIKIEEEESMLDEDVKPDVNYHHIVEVKEGKMSTKRKRMDELCSSGDKDYINGDQYDDEDDPANEEGMRSNEEPSFKRSMKLKKKDKFSSSSNEFGDHNNQNISIDYDEECISFGPNETSIKEWDYYSIKWDSYKLTTRGLLMAVFGKRILSTHCLSGKQSNGYVYKTSTSRPQLNVKKVEDIISIVSEKCGIVTTSLIRNVISQKCFDESRASKVAMKRMAKFMGKL